MMKKILLFIVMFICCFNYVEAEEFDITSDNVILYNLNDNKVLYEKNSQDKVEIASLTKIMTTLVAIENIDDINKEVVITSEVFRGIEGYSTAGLSVGDKVIYKDLLYGIMLPSGADCVNAAILGLGKSKSEFIKLMNDKAQKIGLSNTKFDNAIGMDSDDNYSSASDIAKLLKYALENETFKTIFTTKKYTIDSTGLKMNSTLISYSKTLDVGKVLGAKSGFTDGAGLCLASIANYDDVNYLLVVLGASTKVRSNAIKDSLTIYDYYSKNYEYKNILKKNQVLKKVKVKWGYDKTYTIKSDKDISTYLKTTVDVNDLEYDYDGIDEITYQNKKGSKLGIVTIKYNGEELAKYDVYLAEELKFYHPIIYGIILISIIMMIISIILMRKKKKRRKRKKGRR